MNTNCTFAVNEARTATIIPPEMLRAGSTCLPGITSIMLLYGVGKIELGQMAYGSILLIAPRSRDIPQLEKEIPAWALQSKKQALYHLSQLMLLLGLFGVEILPSEQELEVIRQRWRSCENTADGSPKAAPADPAQLQLAPPPIEPNNEVAVPLAAAPPVLPPGPLLAAAQPQPPAAKDPQ